MRSLVADSPPFVPGERRPVVLRSRQVDLLLLGSVLLLVGLGLVMVFEASYFIGAERFGDPYALIRRQTLFILLASCVAFVMSRVDPLLLRPLPWHEPDRVMAVAQVRPDGSAFPFLVADRAETWSEAADVLGPIAMYTSRRCSCCCSSSCRASVRCAAARAAGSRSGCSRSSRRS